MNRHLDAFLGRHVHVVVRARGGRRFALVGGWKARHVIQRLLVGTLEPLPARPVFHREATPDGFRALARELGVVVFCGDAAPAELRPDLLTIPLLVQAEMDTPRVFSGPGTPWRTGAKEDIRRVRLNRFAYDIQGGEGWVPEFYGRMFRPTMLERHGRAAYLATERQVREQARTAGVELLRVLKDGRWVAGSVNQSTPDGYRLIKIGWIPDDALLRQRVVAAMYWFNLQRAAALASPRVTFGGVPPCIEDGLFRYKTKWGARLCADDGWSGYFRLLLDPSHPTCRDLVGTHSLIARGASGSWIVLSGSRPGTVQVTPAVVDCLSGWYTWRDEASAHSEPGSNELPRALRPWLSPHNLRDAS